MAITKESEPLLLQETKNGTGKTYKSYGGNDSTQKGNNIPSTPNPNNGLSSPVRLNINEESIIYSWRDIQAYAKPEKSIWKTAFKWAGCKRRKYKDQGKLLLQNVSGDARPGELLAIMGSSGAGKTTLLDCLTFRSRKNISITGYRNINGKPVSPSCMAAISAYVQQEDLFIGTLTVKEHLIFQALVRMDRHIPYAKRLERVEEVISELQLTKCQKTLIGIPGKLKGISGGEMKRLSFASEVLTNPLIMFCDEPTSGLDSFMAQNVVTVLKELASKGKTIICTIHQPSSEVYATFDRILLMAEGKLAFLGTPTEAQSFFKSLGAECPSNHNPADFFVQLLAVAPTREETCRKMITMICEAFRTSKIGTKLQFDIEEKTQGTAIVSKSNSTSPYKASWCAQFRAVFWRSWLNVIKDPQIVKVKMLQTMMVALLIGLVYFGQEIDQDGVMNINGALFVALTNMTFQNMFAVIHVFCLELPIFMREHLNGMYRTDVYFLCKTLAESPVYLAVPVLFTTVIYYMIGLNPLFSRLLGNMAVMILISFVSTSFGYFISCISSNIGVALAIGPPIVIPFLLFGGFFLNTASIPKYLKWFSYLSWFKYGNEALLINQWKGIDEIACTRQNTTCPPNGAIVLETFNFDGGNYGFDLFCLLLIIIGFRVMAFLALLTRAYLK